MDVGFLGAFFILFAWAYETYKTYKKGERLDIKFLTAYVIGLSLLTYYSYQINSMPFLVLNLVILLFTLIELELTLRQRQKSKNRR